MQQMTATQAVDDSTMAELNQAGAGVDRAIHTMLERGLTRCRSPRPCLAARCA